MSFATMTGQFFVIKLICPRRWLKIWPGWVCLSRIFLLLLLLSFRSPPTSFVSSSSNFELHKCTTSISTESNQACHTSHQRYTRSRSKWRSQNLAYQDRTEGDHCIAWEGFHFGCVAGVEAQIWWWMNKRWRWMKMRWFLIDIVCIYRSRLLITTARLSILMFIIYSRLPLYKIVNSVMVLTGLGPYARVVQNNKCLNPSSWAWQ